MELSDKHYLDHLNEVNTYNKVILSEDIYNKNGALVVSRGVEVDIELTCKVAKHKLVKPIDQSIELTNLISYEKVIEVYSERLQGLGVIDSVKNSGYFQEATKLFKTLFQYPLIIQKLSILQHRIPDSFARSLSTSSLTIGICKELNLSREVTENVFITNVISDVGLLHIDPVIINSDKEYTKEEWKMMQGHVVIAKHFADQIPKLPTQVGRALIEHHERMDGFGYPYGKKASELCIEGQIIAIVDKVYGLVKKYIRHGSHSWPSVIHAMQIASTAHCPNVHNAMMRLLKSFSFPYKPAFSEKQYVVVVKSCFKKIKQLQQFFTELDQIYLNHEELFNNSEDFNSVDLLKNLEYMIINTGVLTESQQTWLQTLEKEILPSDYVDLEEFSLLLDEIKYSCFFVIRHLESSQDDLAKHFGGAELLSAYYLGLKKMLTEE